MNNDSTALDMLENRFRPKLVSNLLLWLILGFFLIAILWAVLTEIDRSVRGMGRVIPSGQLQIISNLEGGIVDAIFVKTGQKVKAGEALLRLDKTQSNADLGSGQAALQALAAKVERLRAEVTGGTPKFAKSDPQAEIENILFLARRSEFLAITVTGQERVKASIAGVGEAQSILAARRAQANAAVAELSAIRPLVERGIDPQLSLSLAQGKASAAVSEVAAAVATVARAKAGVAEAQSALIQQNQDWRARAGNELASAQAELSARTRTMPALADRVQRTLVVAPLDGRINRVLVATNGGVVAPGNPLVEIVPSNDSLVIEVQIDPKDIASIRTGQRAEISITAYDSATYGRLSGQVISISPDAIINERTDQSYYLVRIRTDRSGLNNSSGKKLPIGAGMVVEASLLGEKQSVLSYVFSPFTKLKQQAFRE